MGKHRIFVYGTLKRGFYNSYLLNTSLYIGKAKTVEPIFTMRRIANFPAVFANGSSFIHGEVYEVNDGVLDNLDHLENHPNWYKRQNVIIEYEAGNIETVQMYVMTKEWETDLYSKSPIIEEGIYNDRIII
jgi:gamma-glutamylaminecyclotransferase